jgi:hypothetical protein
MRATLIVANRTVGGDALVAAVRERLSSETDSFHLMIPVASSGSATLAMGPLAFDVPIDHADVPHECARAAERLKFGLQWLAGLGAAATGEVIVDADTVAVVCAAVTERSIDEVTSSHIRLTTQVPVRRGRRSRARAVHPGDT